jgi:hypothetical protein
MMLLLYVERAVVVLLAAVALLLAIVSFRQASGSTVAFLEGCGFGFRYIFDPGIRVRDEHPGSYFRELTNHFLGKNTVIL